MASLSPTGGAGVFEKAFGWFGSSRPKTTAFQNLTDKSGKSMTKAEREAFLAREDAKAAKGNGLVANTPLSSRYT